MSAPAQSFSGFTDPQSLDSQRDSVRITVSLGGSPGERVVIRMVVDQPFEPLNTTSPTPVADCSLQVNLTGMRPPFFSPYSVRQSSSSSALDRSQP